MKKNLLLISFTLEINQSSNNTSYDFFGIIIDLKGETVLLKQIYNVIWF